MLRLQQLAAGAKFAPLRIRKASCFQGVQAKAGISDSPHRIGIVLAKENPDSYWNRVDSVGTFPLC